MIVLCSRHCPSTTNIPRASSCTLLVSLGLTLDPEHLNNFHPETRHFPDMTGFIAINAWRLPQKIKLTRLDNLGLLQNLPAEVQNRSQKLHGVVLEEGGDTTRFKRSVPVEGQDQGQKENSDVSTVRLKVAGIGQPVAVEALILARVVEVDVGDADDQVIDEGSCGDQ